jgi:uncharacterized membrane protein
MSIPAVGDRVTVIADAGIVRRRQGYSWKDDMRNVSCHLHSNSFMHR